MDYYLTESEFNQLNTDPNCTYQNYLDHETEEKQYLDDVENDMYERMTE